MKRVIYIAVSATLLLSLAGCHKNCVCKERDGTESRFSDADLDTYGVTCSKMVDYPVSEYRVVCNWE